MRTCTYDNLEYNGRLANQFWQVAATASRAVDLDAVPRFRPDWSYREFTSLPEEFYDPPGEVVWDGGTNYFQELQFIENVKDDVHWWFTPPEEALELITYPEGWGEVRWKISLHVRRGDYLKYPRHFPMPTERYYRTALGLAQAELPDAQVFVFSDDPEWCRSKFPDCTVVEGVTTPVDVGERVDKPMDWVDLFLMSCCDANVLANSTFSWWGAYLGLQDLVYYPSKWFGPPVPNHERWKYAMPDDWKMIQC